MIREDLDRWFINLKMIDKLSLYEGCEKLGVSKQEVIE